jgi:hypothetical protein
MDDLHAFADRYLALWNEPDPAQRRARIAELFAPGGGQVLADPPQEVRAVADHHQFPAPTLAVHGHGALDARVTRAYELFVAPGEYRFAAAAEPTRLLDHVVALPWTMVSTADGSPAVGVNGVNLLHLDEDGRIATDYLFVGR